MSVKETVLVAAVGASAVIALVRGIVDGEFNLGGGRVADFHVSWAEDPRVFGFGVVLMLVLAGICVVYLWRRWRG